MQWEKKGLIFAVGGATPWRRTHACLPTPVHRGGDLYRVYFAGRDEHNRSHVGSFDILLREPFPIVRVAEQPVLAPGPLGNFDDHGVYASSVVPFQGRLFMYTVGWNQGACQPLFYSSIGLAISEDGETFRRYSPAPILARSEHDPCSVVSSHVQIDEVRWRMWYVSCVRWEETAKGMQSFYHVKYAESLDGVDWKRTGHVAFDFSGPDETNIGRPSILRNMDGYQAWLPHANGKGCYRIGYAESPDALHWTRKDDQAGIDISDSGWDSQMIAHPAIVRHDGLLYMFYNGNQFGKAGVGLAVAKPMRSAIAA